MRSFEIQVYKDGKWKMDSVYDDREHAVGEAKRIDGNNRFAGVRVIEENYDEATNQVTSRTLFRGGAAKGKTALNPVSNAKPRQVRSRGGTGRERNHKGSNKRQSKKSNLLVPVLVLLAVILCGVVVLLWLQQLLLVR